MADLLRVGSSRSDLSKLATFLVRLRGEVGHAARREGRHVCHREMIHQRVLSHPEDIFNFRYRLETTWQLQELIISPNCVVL